MLKDITDVKVLPEHKLWMQFEDGVKGTVNFCELANFRGVFAPLSNPEEFAKATINRELGVICWPNGADLDSDVLYAKLTNQPIPLA